MHEKDIILKNYEKDNARFCSFVNGVLAGGRPLLLPERLENMPTEILNVLEVPSGRQKGGRERRKIKTVQRFRDLTKKYKTDDGYIIIAIQNQSKVDFGMPLRVMLEDALEYDAQLRQHKNGALHKSERLMEVITIVFYHGSAPWSGGLSMSDIVRVPEALKELERYRPSYSMILVTPETVKAEQFSGEWREVFEILKRQNNEFAMKRHLEENRGRYDALSEDTRKLLFALTGHLTYYKEMEKRGEKASMCKAFEDHYKSGVKEGRKEGRREGRKENERRFQSLIAAMVQSGETALLPRLAEPGNFLSEMYQKYSL